MQHTLGPNRAGRPTSHWILMGVCFLLFTTTVFSASLISIRNVHALTPAVSQGQWAHYSLSGNQSEGVVDALFTVQSVSGPNVTFTDFDTFADGHNSTDTVFVSILTGPTIASSGEYFVIAPQLHINDLVYPGNSHYNLPVQDLSGRPYASATRQTAHIHASNSSTIIIQGQPPQTTYEDFYWDQSTGMFTEIAKVYNGATVLHVMMSSTNIWQPANSLDPYLIPSAVISLTTAGLIGVIVFSRVRRKKRSR